MKRSLCDRVSETTDLPDGYYVCHPQLFKTDVEFIDSRPSVSTPEEIAKKSPSASSKYIIDKPNLKCSCFVRNLTLSALGTSLYVRF